MLLLLPLYSNYQEGGSDEICSMTLQHKLHGIYTCVQCHETSATEIDLVLQCHDAHSPTLIFLELAVDTYAINKKNHTEKNNAPNNIALKSTLKVEKGEKFKKQDSQIQFNSKY